MKILVLIVSATCFIESSLYAQSILGSKIEEVVFSFIDDSLEVTKTEDVESNLDIYRDNFSKSYKIVFNLYHLKIMSLSNFPKKYQIEVLKVLGEISKRINSEINLLLEKESAVEDDWKFLNRFCNEDLSSVDALLMEIDTDISSALMVESRENMLEELEKSFLNLQSITNELLKLEREVCI